ncbi:helix-turn-helix transcriptional regulator [Halobacillus litoralis]|uniref:helix-turn-helix domain-containing protein n=1 Tax=Halobacillus litoralis TaxID=45668 RepID=UPI001CFC9762|nr:helix-turn-helix transcriptional regulator [Halobacillus litoralis]WLR46559.1 helix-turn-helix transcriptional regulator [Halobacillus litoralis]
MSIDWKKELAINIRNRRKELGLTQNDLAKKVGIGRTTISRIENEFHNPYLDTLEKLAKALEIDPKNLFRTD